MSLEATALSPPPSDSSSTSESVSSPVSQPTTTAPAEQLTAPKPGSTEIGGNGGPDWRSMIGGQDQAAIERLSRFKEPGDLWKSYRELEGKLSQRQAPQKFPDNPTPEAVAEWRKSIGVAEIAKDAKPEAYLDAYKIKAPDGYEMSEVEKGLLTDYAKEAYDKGYSPREVQSSVEFFFKQQAASTQALNKMGVEFQKAEQNGWRDAVGSKEYEAQVSAAQSWLTDQFKDNPDQMQTLLNARLPNGGKLGDSRWFGELLAKQAMGDGYTDRIEANAYEANGKSLAEQQRSIEGLMRTDRAKYNEPNTQAQLKKIIALRQSRGEIDEWGNERKR